MEFFSVRDDIKGNNRYNYHLVVSGISGQQTEKF